MIPKPLLISLESKAIDEEKHVGLDKGVYFGKDGRLQSFWYMASNEQYATVLSFITFYYWYLWSQKSEIYPNMNEE